jgi:hypothetical protein
MKLPTNYHPVTNKTEAGQEIAFHTTSDAYAFEVGKVSGLGTHVVCGLDRRIYEPWSTEEASQEFHFPAGVLCKVLLTPTSGPATIINGQPLIDAECQNVPINGGGYFPQLELLFKPGSLQ